MKNEKEEQREEYERINLLFLFVFMKKDPTPHPSHPNAQNRMPHWTDIIRANYRES